jgi:hypothetical protein
MIKCNVEFPEFANRSRTREIEGSLKTGLFISDFTAKVRYDTCIYMHKCIYIHVYIHIHIYLYIKVYIIHVISFILLSR